MRWLAAALVAALAITALYFFQRAPRPEPPRPTKFSDAFTVHGIDVSRHNGVIDWPTVKASGITFAFIKATEGGDLIDPRFSANLSGAREAGLRVGAYHFFTFCRPGADQAKNFLATYTRAPSDLAPVVDVEFVGNCKNAPPPETIRAELETWLTAVERELETEVVIYTTPDADDALLRGLARPRWIRAIGSRTPDSPWRFWQFDASGSVPGIEGSTDLDVFSGAPGEL